jgi:hypothetical protein
VFTFFTRRVITFFTLLRRRLLLGPRQAVLHRDLALVEDVQEELVGPGLPDRLLQLAQDVLLNRSSSSIALHIKPACVFLEGRLLMHADIDVENKDAASDAAAVLTESNSAINVPSSAYCRTDRLHGFIKPTR